MEGREIPDAPRAEIAHNIRALQEEYAAVRALGFIKWGYRPRGGWGEGRAPGCWAGRAPACMRGLWCDGGVVCAIVV